MLIIGIAFSIQVDELKFELDVQEIEVTKKNTKAEELIKVVKKETEKVTFEKDKGINYYIYVINDCWVTVCERNRNVIYL